MINNKIFAKFILRTFTICSIVLFSSTIVSAAKFVTVIKDGVNIRKGPSTNQDVIMEVFKGYPLKVISERGKWLKVSDFENDSGWIYNPLTKKGNSVIVKSNITINMRSGPGTKNDKIATVEPGVVFTKIEKQGNWLKVKHDIQGTVGWIYKPLLWP